MTLIDPHGGTLCNLIPDSGEVLARRKESVAYPSFTLNAKHLCDLELLLNGGFSPLRGFMNQDEYQSVLEKMRLPDGTLWPIPIVLDVGEDTVEMLGNQRKLVLRDMEGNPLAILDVADIWEADKDAEARAVLGTDDIRHSGVALIHKCQRFYVGGALFGIQLPHHYDFNRFRNTPTELRRQFEEKGWSSVVAFQTRNPLHRVHEELMRRAAEEAGAKLLLHPVVGLTQAGDLSYIVRVHCYRNVIKRFPPDKSMLSLLCLAMRMAGPREALWHTIIRKNHGCTHFAGADNIGVITTFDVARSQSIIEHLRNSTFNALSLLSAAVELIFAASGCRQDEKSPEQRYTPLLVPEVHWMLLRKNR